VENPNGVEKGIKEITLNGKPMEGTLLPIFQNGTTNEITVTMG
jgi:hypothetical protein